MGVLGDVVADRAAQVVAEVLEEHRVEAEEAAHRLTAQGPFGASVDRVAPFLGHAVRAGRHLAPGAIGSGQHDP